MGSGSIPLLLQFPLVARYSAPICIYKGLVFESRSRKSWIMIAASTVYLRVLVKGSEICILNVGQNKFFPTCKFTGMPSGGRHWPLVVWWVFGSRSYGGVSV